MEETQLNYKDAYYFLFNRLSTLADLLNQPTPPVESVIEMIRMSQQEAEEIAIREP